VDTDELTALLREVRERVRARHPRTAGGLDVPLPDLMPVVHARDAALGKVAAIGTVNPRPGGPLNAVVQAWKKLVARVLDWHVREQVEFNRNLIACIDALTEALAESNRALAEIGSRMAGETDLRDHWAQWRLDWERKLSENEIQFLRSVADLQGAFQHRVTLMETNLREQIQAQHRDYTVALEHAGLDIQKRLWADLERMRADYERLIFAELKLIRQRSQTAPVTAPQQSSSNSGKSLPAPAFDYGRFAERYRGSEEYVKAGQQFYKTHFQGCRGVLDLGCGRGEFLELMRDLDVPAHGIDLNAESIAVCRSKGLDAETADLFEHLRGLAESSLDGIFCSQVVEHLPPERLPEAVKLAASRLVRGGVFAIETPNPECLAIFATHFYLDPTHARPVPHPLLAFYMEESGLGAIEVHKLSPAVESMPALASLPADFRDAFFGGLDYAIIGRKL
jgi:O-antigen chain-terminating methyltransferase